MAISLAYIAPGSIGNYSDLVDLVGEYLDRDDLVDVIPRFVVIGEAEINRRLRTLEQEVKDLWVIEDEEFLLPDAFKRIRKLHIEGQPDRPLKEISPVAAPMAYDGSAGIPEAYWIEGDTLTLAPPPARATTFRVTYFMGVPHLTNDAPSNWLFERHPDVYVWVTLREAAAYIRDPDALDYASGRFDTAIEQVKLESRTDRFGGGPLVPTVPAPGCVCGVKC